jgi:putative aldouronate transport system substrate-binding protein
MNQAKKLICLLMASMLLLGMAACGSGGSTQSSASAQSSAAAGSAESAGPAAQPSGDGEWKPTADYSQKVHYTLATVQSFDGFDYTAGDAVAKYYSDKFNYDIEVTTLTFDNWAERLRIWINSGDMPDVCVFDYKHADATGFVDQGLIKKLPDGWRDRWTNLAKVFDVTTLGPQMEKTFGGVYFIPRARFNRNIPGNPLPDHTSMYIRKDWAEAVGFPVKSTYTTSEIIQYGNLIKEKDPGKIGDKLVPISSRPHWATMLFVGKNSTHYNNFYKDKDGQYKWGGASEDTLKGLKLYQEAMKSGALNPEFFTLKDGDDYDQFRVAGVSGGFFGEATVNWIEINNFQPFQKNTGLDPDKCVNIATVLGDDGNYHQEDLINYWGTIIFNPQLDDNKFERYLDMLDYNSTEKGYLFSRMGFENEDYKYDDKGELVSLLDPSTPISGKTGKYPSIGNVLAGVILPDDFSFQNPFYKKEYRDLSWQLYTERCKVATPDTFAAVDWNVYCHDSPSMRKAIFDYDTEYTNLVTSAGDLETNWKKWIKERSPMVQPVLDELNALGK